MCLTSQCGRQAAGVKADSRRRRVAARRGCALSFEPAAAVTTSLAGGTSLGKKKRRTTTTRRISSEAPVLVSGPVAARGTGGTAAADGALAGAAAGRCGASPGMSRAGFEIPAAAVVAAGCDATAGRTDVAAALVSAPQTGREMEIRRPRRISWPESSWIAPRTAASF